jgi:predicted amidohydrolase
MIIGLVQLNSKLDWKENIQSIDDLIASIKPKNPEAIFLPECFLSMSNGLEPSPFLPEEGNEYFEAISNIAKKYQVALIGGSVAYNLNGKVMNRVLNFNSDGSLMNYYDKNHLFSIELKSKSINKSIDEADIYTAGNESQTLEFGDFKFGINVCFDLRFSEQALGYFNQGCNVLTYASAFTVPTGKAHWHTLLRARAIETQSFVIASAQWGEHNERIKTYGHSLVVDPWGEVLLDLENGVKADVVEINLETVQKVRSRIPMTR